MDRIQSPHPDFPELSSLVKIGTDSRRGRYIEAVQDIPLGTVICSEKGLVVALEKNRCSYCLRPVSSTEIHCSNCAPIHGKYENIEGLFWEELNQLGMVAPTIRILLSFSAKVLEDHFIHDKHPSACLFTKIFALKCSQEPGDFQPIQDFLLRFQRKLLSRADWKKSPRNLFSRAFSGIFSRLKVNAHVVTEIDRNSLEEKPIGSGIFPISSIFNHSCRANVFSFFSKDRFVWVSLGIRKGEEVLDNYGVQAHSVDYEQRKGFLAGRGFLCQCKICERGPEGEELVARLGFEIPPTLSLSEIQNFTRAHNLSQDHIDIFRLLQGSIFQGAKDAVECLAWARSNQMGRGVVFEPDMVNHYVVMIRNFRGTDSFAPKIKTWILSALILMHLYYRNLHPCYAEIHQLWLKIY